MKTKIKFGGFVFAAFILSAVLAFGQSGQSGSKDLLGPVGGSKDLFGPPPQTQQDSPECQRAKEYLARHNKTVPKDCATAIKLAGDLAAQEFANEMVLQAGDSKSGAQSQGSDASQTPQQKDGKKKAKEKDSRPKPVTPSGQPATPPASPRDIDRLHDELFQRDRPRNISNPTPTTETDDAIPTPTAKGGNGKPSVSDALDGLSDAYGDRKPADGTETLKGALGDSPAGEYNVRLKTKSDFENEFYARHKLDNPRTVKSQEDVKLEPLTPGTQGEIFKSAGEDIITGELGRKAFGNSYGSLLGLSVTAGKMLFEYGDEKAKNQKLAEYEAYQRSLPVLEQDIAALETRKKQIQDAVAVIKANGGQLDQWGSDKVPGTLFEINNEIGALQKLKTEFNDNSQKAKSWLEDYVKSRGKPAKEYPPNSL